MLPLLLLVGLGKRRRFWLPLPTILLWPLWLLGWPIWFLLHLVRSRWDQPVRMGLILPMHLAGLQVDVESNNGDNVHLRTF